MMLWRIWLSVWLTLHLTSEEKGEVWRMSQDENDQCEIITENVRGLWLVRSWCDIEVGVSVLMTVSLFSIPSLLVLLTSHCSNDPKREETRGKWLVYWSICPFSISWWQQCFQERHMSMFMLGLLEGPQGGWMNHNKQTHPFWWALARVILRIIWNSSQ